jgi:diguanylate cyclase (GGDEF)-like protein
MGLRAKLIVSMIGMFALLGGASSYLLREKIQGSYAQLERDAALAGMGRVMLAISEELDRLNEVTREDSNWTELHDYMSAPAGDFLQANLGTGALLTANLSWVSIHNRQLQRIYQLSVDKAAAQARAIPELLAADSPLEQFVKRQPFNPQERNCGFLRTQQGLIALCHRPILDSNSQNAPNGVLTLGRLVDKQMLARLQKRTDLQFQILPHTTHADGKTGLVLPLSTPLGQSLVHYHQAREGLQLGTVLFDLAGRPCARIELDWPSLIISRGKQVIAQTEWQLALLIAVCALGMWWVVNQVVIARLGRLWKELNALQGSKEWQRRILAGSRDEIGAVGRQINLLLQVIEQQVQELEVSSQTDPLTSLWNRRAYDLQLDFNLSHARRTGEPLALLLIDVDYFKLFNDRYGHHAGDQALLAVAGSLAQIARRDTDICARLGGEEFAVLLPNTMPQQAEQLAQAMQQALAECRIRHELSPVAEYLTISIGLAMAEAGESADSLYNRADCALYLAKAAGRNRVHIADAGGDGQT